MTAECSTVYNGVSNSVDVNSNDLGTDAWGRNKTVSDVSLFHGMFTYSVPQQMWLEYINGVEQTAFSGFTSANGRLKIQGTNGQSNLLMSKRHPRYQPNRGHLYSTAMILPDAANAANQEFGLFHAQAGVFFRINAGVLYAVRRTIIDGTIVNTVETITLPAGIDLTKGNVYDIQMQWRGVGNIKFFINLQLVHTMEILGRLSEVSIWNPALPIAFNIDGVATMYCGCVDATSEGGQRENRQRGSVDSEEVTLSTAETPVLLMRSANTVLYNGVNVMNTRDIALRRISGYSDAATIVKMYYTRDSSKFTGTTWTNDDPEGFVQYSIDGNITLVGGTTGLDRQITRRIAANDSLEVVNPDNQLGDFYLTHGDYVLITMTAKNSTLGGAAMEWGAEV